MVFQLRRPAPYRPRTKIFYTRKRAKTFYRWGHKPVKGVYRPECKSIAYLAAGPLRISMIELAKRWR